MPQSLAQIWIHIVFSTKGRRAFLQHKSFRCEMFRMLAHQVKQSDCVSAAVGGYIDHVHLLVGLCRTLTLARLVEHAKTETSKWAKRTQNGVGFFRWQSGYGAFSVSHSMLESVDQYIREQEVHHKKMTFQEEYRRLCRKHHLAIDERYVWD